MKRTTRVIVVTALVLAATVPFLLLAGCEMSAVGPDGVVRTAQEWEAREERVKRQAEADTAQALREKDLEQGRILAAAKAAEEAAKLEAARRRKRFDAEVAKLQAQTGMQLADLAAVYDLNELDASATLAATLAQVNARAAELDRATAARIDSNASTIAEASAQTEEALKRIEAKQARILGGIKLAEGAAGALGGPVGGALAALLGTGGLGGLLFGAAQRKRAAIVQAEQQRREGVMKDVLNALEVVKEKSPEFKQTLKDNKGLLDSWMGAAGVNLVNELTA